MKEDQKSKRAYLIMEYLDGCTLEEFLANGHDFDSFKTIDIIVSLAKAVQVLHNKGICHRDIKPQNIIVTKTGETKIIDFNISKTFKREHSENTNKFYSKFSPFICCDLLHMHKNEK